jgi:hypothetical protein
MSELSARLSLPFLQPAQAQKHVTHNEALERLDLLVQLVLEGFDAIAPPVAAIDGQVWALGLAPQGDWAGQGGKLAARVGGAWLFVPPAAGWCATHAAQMRVFDGQSWVVPEPGALQNLQGIGIGTSYDANNPLAVAGQSSLLTHQGAGHQLKINKNAATDTASLLFQTGWSGRAEMGTAGNDDFSIKVSPDGASFLEALVADGSTGHVTLPQGAAVEGVLSGTAVTQSSLDTTAGRVTKVGDFGLGSDSGQTVADLDDLRYGSMLFPLNATSGPVGAHSLLTQARLSGARATQFAIGDAALRAFIRNYGTASGALAWSDWAELFHTQNILGTVSQTGGVPTGAILQRGSNANGAFVRFADGTQICTNDNNPIVTDPAVFVGTVTSIDGDKLRIGRWF